jgi:DNA-binding transcriptional LysR family regulator
MDLRVLRYYLAVCQEKNITKAAESLRIAQPSLSTQIKGLEQELGVTLFERGHRQIKLTEEGYFLRDRAQELVSMADQTERIIQSSKLITGTLRIGAGQSIALKRIMKIIASISQEQHDVNFQFLDGNADDIEARVNEGSLDFGVIMGDRSLENFDSLILPERNEFIACFRKDHPLAAKDKITPKDLIKYPIISSNQTLVTDKFHNWWGNLYNQVNILAQGNLAYNAALLASESDAVQITYDHLVDYAALDLITRPLSPKVTDPNIVIWKKNVRQSNLANHFLQELRNSLN